MKLASVPDVPAGERCTYQLHERVRLSAPWCFWWRWDERLPVGEPFEVTSDPMCKPGVAYAFDPKAWAGVL